MATLIKLYPLLKQLGLDDQKSQEFIETLEQGLLEHVATKTDVEKVRANLTQEIEKVRLEIEKLRADLAQEIEKLRAALTKEIEKLRADLALDIEKLRGEVTQEIGKVRVEIEKVRISVEGTRAELLKWLFGAWATLFLAILALFFKLA